MDNTPSEAIQLKFEGPPIKKMGGAPAEFIISSLTALQRLVHLIGMRSEGKALGQRVKPSAKVRRDYAVVCHAPAVGSHIQPFTIATQTGAFTPAAGHARDALLKALKAFDSGEAETVERVIPNARERWFMADAAAGLLPPEDSGIEVTLRAGSFGPFGFKADRARGVIEHFRAGSPPKAAEETVVGKLKAVDYSRAVLTVQPSGGRAVRLQYPLQLEPLLQANVRKRISILGDPTANTMGDVTGFDRLVTLSEVESVRPPIEHFSVGDRRVEAIKPIAVLVSFDFENRLFTYENIKFGISAYSATYDGLVPEIKEELAMLWRNYAEAPDDELAEDALSVKRALNHSFRALRQ